MKYTYYSSLFSMYAQIAGAVSGADKQKKNVIINKISGVGIKFDVSSAEKLYPDIPGIKKYSWFEDEGNDGHLK